MKITNSKIFTSELLCLKDVEEFNFTIPTYQRPYVWGDEQLKKLIDDFYIAYLNDKESPYYISSLITKDYGENEKLSELIDGQQRFTTLWLISLVISKLTENNKSELEKFLKKDDKLRLSFEIRSEVYEYLLYLIENNQHIKSKIINEIESYPYLKNITKAVTSIKGYLKDALFNTNSEEYEDELRKFGNFIYTKVYFIKNSTPTNTDLNKLFSTINNSGIQLEQSDIVKAKLLKVIGKEKVLYSKIWESCENMNNFFERNARTSFPSSNWNKIDFSKEFEFDKSIFKYTDDENNINSEKNTKDDFKIDELNIDEISEYPFCKKTFENEEKRESEEIYCRSIISFEQLLLHTYRLHLRKEDKEDFKGTFHANRLIEVFKELEKRNNTEEIKRFFSRLWKVRYLFDKYLIKWISDTNTKNESLEIVNFTRNKESYYSRTTYEKSNILMLQSVLYFTGDYLRQYWVSAYLGYLYDNHENQIPTSEKHLKQLEQIDNIFSLNKNIKDKELSWEMINQKYNFANDFNFELYLKQSNGTGFKHYWFYKLEYVLWKNWENKDDPRFKNYRITSKNSVEHIYPQHPENELENPKLETQDLDSFGNLVLLSMSQNSEYSNKSVNVKRSMFQEKSNSYDTLKSYFIFDKNKWEKENIIEHRKNMIEKLLNYYLKN